MPYVNRFHLKPEVQRDSDDMDRLILKNRAWAATMRAENTDFFKDLADHQHPEYLWIGCSDSRVTANEILGLQPGDVFVQRNVGNQARHSDMNLMSCLEYSVGALKVKNIIVCGHYNCGAVKAALQLPCETPGLVNCWISNIREVRNASDEQLRAVEDCAERANLLSELNVKAQVFNICTSSVVTNAWKNGQQVNVYGVCYSLKDGQLKKLVGPINADEQLAARNAVEYVKQECSKGGKSTKVIDVRSGKVLRLTADEVNCTDRLNHMLETAALIDSMNAHLAWAESK